MQLDLFTDNRRNILINDATHLLRSLELEKALAVYEEILADDPSDTEVLVLRKEVEIWCERFDRWSSTGLGGLYEIHKHIFDRVSNGLRAGLLAFLAESLQALDKPQLIYIPPRFHLGCVLHEAERYTDAANWYAVAVQSGIAEKGRFLAWQGDSLTLCGRNTDAMECYLAAFLEDPDTVDLDGIANPLICDLILTLISECCNEEINEQEAVPWLPCWGFIQGEFSLSTKDIAVDPEAFSALLRHSDASGNVPQPRLWYEYLRYAEFLRTSVRDDRELLLVRQRMRTMHAKMFDRYIGSVGNRKRGT